MSRSVQATQTVPVHQAEAHAEVLDSDNRGGGLQEIAKSQNDHYEYLRGLIAYDFQPVARVSTGTGLVQTLEGRTQGKGLATESADIWVHAILQSDVTVTVTELSTGNSVSHNGVADGNLLGTWTKIGTIAVDDTIDSLQFEVEVTQWAGGGEQYDHKGGLVVYSRTKTELTAGEYSNGFVPLDPDRSYVGENGVSTPKAWFLNRNAKALFENFVGQISCSDEMDLAGSVGTVMQATPPRGATNATFKVTARNALGLSSGRLLTVRGNNDIKFTTLNNSANAEFTFVLDVVPGEKQRFFVTGEDDNITIDIVRAWWNDAVLT